MTHLAQTVRAALDSDRPIQRHEVVLWCRTAEHVVSLELLYRLTDEEHERIRPGLSQQEACELIQKYLLTCVRLDPGDEGVFGRYEAARTLVGWFQHLSSLREDTALCLARAVSG